MPLYQGGGTPYEMLNFLQRSLPTKLSEGPKNAAPADSRRLYTTVGRRIPEPNCAAKVNLVVFARC